MNDGLNPSRGVVGVAMSGGVDSSVAAALLKMQGYEIIGLTMHLWTDPEGSGFALNRASGCCSIDMSRDAASVAERMGFRHYVLDLSREFHGSVIKNFGHEYLRGRTPNPCVRCNTFVKWQTLLERARKLGCDYLATGHYARVDHSGARSRLLRAKNLEKDQSYALWGLTQDRLKHTLFPIGELTKADVRRIAADLGLKTADKPESQDICFIPDDDYRRFVKQYFKFELPILERGEIVDADGKVLGYHDGVMHYTIGQRKGLGISAPYPLYVTSIDVRANRVHVASDEGCFSQVGFAEDANWISIDPPTESIRCAVKIRYRDDLHPARVFPLKGGQMRIEFIEPVRAITPGQSAVLFDGEIVLGGGVLCEPQDMEDR